MDIPEAIKVLAQAGAVFCLPPDSKRSLTLDQVQERIGFKRSWVISHLHEFPNRWRGPGGGQHGGEWRIPERDVDAFERRQRVIKHK